MKFIKCILKYDKLFNQTVNESRDYTVMWTVTLLHHLNAKISHHCPMPVPGRWWGRGAWQRWRAGEPSSAAPGPAQTHPQTPSHAAHPGCECTAMLEGSEYNVFIFTLKYEQKKSLAQ